MTGPDAEEYVKALERLKKSPRDRVGILGQLGVTGIGVGAGVAASGTIAAAAGGATLLGSSTLASVLGGVFVTSTPIGWVVGSAAVGGLLASAAVRLVRSGATADLRKRFTIDDLEARIQEIHRRGREDGDRDKKMRELITGLQYLVVNGRISQEKSTELLVAVEERELSADDALDVIRSISAS